MSIKRFRWKIEFFWKKDKPFSTFRYWAKLFRLLVQNFWRLSKKSSVFCRKKNWPGRRNCSSSVKTIFFDEKDCLENNCRFFNRVGDWATKFLFLSELFSGVIKNGFHLSIQTFWGKTVFLLKKKSPYLMTLGEFSLASGHKHIGGMSHFHFNCPKELFDGKKLFWIF